MSKVLVCNNCGYIWLGDYSNEDYCPECDSCMIAETDYTSIEEYVENENIYD